MHRKLLVSITASALLAAGAAGSITFLVLREDEFTKQAKPILRPVDKTTASLADVLRGSEASGDLPAVDRAARRLERATATALTQARGLDSSDHRQVLLLDFLRATQVYALNVGAATTKLTFRTASEAERTGSEGQGSLHALDSSDGDLPLPERDDFAAVERLSTLAKRCGGVPPGSVAIVGDRAVAKAEITELLAQARSSYRLQGGTLPARGSPEYQGLVRQAMSFLVKRIEFAETARDLKITVAGNDVERRLRRIKRQFFGNDRTGYWRQLKRLRLTDAQVRKDVRASLVRERVYRRVTQGFRDKPARRRTWTAAMRKRFARKTLYRAGYPPRGVRGAPPC